MGLLSPSRRSRSALTSNQAAGPSTRVWSVTPRIPDEAIRSMEPFPPLAAQLLHNRGISDAEAAEAFLARDERLLEDPALLPGMDRAVDRIRTALDRGESIGVFGDFDADGVTGTALLAAGLEQLGARVIPYLPHRTAEGHGLSSQAVHALDEQGASLIVTVDCGVASLAEVAEAATLGMDTIITDHHSPLPLLPAALAIVNPRLDGSTYPNPGLAGVGLAFKLVQGLCDSLGVPWDEKLLQLAALGTVTDVTPLLGENRYIVAAGLRSMSDDPLPGLSELLRAGGREGSPVDTEAISFVLGPRLNAPGRLGHAITAYNLLRAGSHEQAMPMAEDLQRLNRERQEMMGRAVDHLKAQSESLAAEERLLMLWSEEYAAGIVGLLASRLSEERYRPAIVAAVEGDLARGSARSIPEFNLAAAFEECSDLFVRYGGHPRAAGFVARCDVLPELRSRLTGSPSASLRAWHCSQASASTPTYASPRSIPRCCGFSTGWPRSARATPRPCSSRGARPCLTPRGWGPAGSTCECG